MVSLTTAGIAKLSKPGRYGDGRGLYLNIAKGGSLSWVQRIYVNGQRLDKGLGSFPTTTLTQARMLADVNRVSVKQGVNPWAKKVARSTNGHSPRLATSATPTFGEYAHKIHGLKVSTGALGNGKHAINWIQVLERHAFPLLGALPLDEVRQRDVLAVLEPIWAKIPDTAKRVRFRIREVFDAAVSAELVAANPAGDGVKGALKSWGGRRQKANHFPALPFEEVPAAVKTIRHSRGQRETRLALEFLVLTATRSCETRGMRWSELSADGRTWTIPPERMKGGREHRVPLSIQAQVLLRSAKEAVGKRLKRRPDYDPNGLVFPNPSGKALSENALSLRCHKDGLACVPHGFRSSFRTWAEERSGASHAAIELSLAHVVGSAVERAYQRSDLLAQRRLLMEAWADYLQPPPF